uniref:MHC class I antigen n=1 Tax=Amblyrhynchus cristatus TaxID=51208 RepID=B5LN04_AMBCR|nr:MHC class I antigen precursor [Amblyrhynchus cristatus]
MASLGSQVGAVALWLWEVLGLAQGAAGPPAQGPDGSSSHSLRYLYMAVSESGQGLPAFVQVGYVDDQPITHYDSAIKRKTPVAPWMEKVVDYDAQYWDRGTRVLQDSEQVFKDNLEIIRNRYNHSEGFHTWQWMYGCELRKDGSIGGIYQCAYDGRDYISLDKETLTWTAADVPAQFTKRRWEALKTAAFRKAYLEVDCIWWLQRYLDYGKEALLRTEPPVGKVTRKAIGNGQEALICQAYGFYPKEIDTSWKKGEEIMDHKTFRKEIAPSSDGTYYIWLSIEIDSKERGLYRCHVDHASLPKPLVLAFEEPGGERLEGA